MHERLIKRLIRHKMMITKHMLNHLPSATAREIKSIGKAILEELNDAAQELGTDAPPKARTSEPLGKIPIE